jgi:hypothetical protein
MVKEMPLTANGGTFSMARDRTTLAADASSIEANTNGSGRVQSKAEGATGHASTPAASGLFIGWMATNRVRFERISDGLPNFFDSTGRFFPTSNMVPKTHSGRVFQVLDCQIPSNGAGPPKSTTPPRLIAKIRIR